MDKMASFYKSTNNIFCLRNKNLFIKINRNRIIIFTVINYNLKGNILIISTINLYALFQIFFEIRNLQIQRLTGLQIYHLMWVYKVKFNIVHSTIKWLHDMVGETSGDTQLVIQAAFLTIDLNENF